MSIYERATEELMLTNQLHKVHCIMSSCPLLRLRDDTFDHMRACEPSTYVRHQSDYGPSIQQFRILITDLMMHVASP